MRVYYTIRDTSVVKQTNAQHEAMLAQWRDQLFAGVVGRRESGPNEQLTVVKRSVTGEYWLGGIDLVDDGVMQTLDIEAGKIDARFKQPHLQLELVALAELQAALPPEDAARAGQLSVLAVAWGEHESAIADIQAYLQANAAIWYSG